MSDLEFGARVAGGLWQLGDDVLHGRKSEALVDEFFGVEPLEGGGVADRLADALAGALADAPDHWVGFGMDGGGVEGSSPSGTRRKQALCRNALSPKRGTAISFLRLGNAPLLSWKATMCSASLVEPEDLGQQRHRGGVEVHPDRVHAALDDGLQDADQPGSA